MGSKVVYVSKPSFLSVKNRQLQVTLIETKEVLSLPLEDISTILIDTSQCSLTGYLMQSFANYKICLIVCNNKHTPCYIASPYYSYCREFEVVKAQITLLEPTKKRIWQKIVKQKIINSSSVLQNLFGIKELNYYVEKVTSGDVSNVEAQAARSYWKLLFSDFKRHGGCKRNKALNYAYAILRSYICKQIVVSGLIPSLGVHHCSELNNFNLADDLIEPFRAFADYKVATCIKGDDDELTKEDKAILVDILNDFCMFENKEVSMQIAIEYFCSSFCKALKNREATQLKFPVLKGIK